MVECELEGGREASDGNRLECRVRALVDAAAVEIELHLVGFSHTELEARVTHQEVVDGVPRLCGIEQIRSDDGVEP